MWLTGPVEDEFLRLARLLKPDDQKRIFEPGFLKRHVREVRTCFDPKLVPAVKDLKQGRCNYPEELTVRTDLARGRGKARCKKLVKDGFFFCHITRHQEFAFVNRLPLSWEDLPKGTATLEPKPAGEKRGRKVDDQPIKPSFRSRLEEGEEGRKAKCGSIKRSRHVESESKAKPASEEKSADLVDDNLDHASIDRILNRLLRRSRFKRCKTGPPNAEEGVTVYDQHDTDGLNQCAFIDPLTQQACRSVGVYEDAGSPCLFCTLHVAVPDDLVHRVEQSTGHSQLLRDLYALQTMDEQIKSLANEDEADKVAEKKKLCIKRFVLASNNGLGTPPAVLRCARGR